MKTYRESRAVYCTVPQQKLLQSPAKKKVCIGGRGAGKTSYTGLQVYLNVRDLPRSKGFIAGLTYQQILNNFLPPMLELWNSLGLVEDVHYHVHKAPARFWRRPHKPFRQYENVISFWNGTAIQLISLDRKDTKRGGNFDWGVFDEAVLLKKEQHDKEIVPMIRGNEHRYTSPLHQSLVYVSSQSWLPSGNWVPDMRHQMDPSKPEEVFYIETTARDNAAVGGERYMERMKKELPILVYNVEVENQRVEQVPDCFYESFDAGRHLYFDSNDYDFDNALRLLTTNRFYDRARPLAFSFDFGGSICCCTVHQDIEDRDRTINALYRKRDTSTPTDRSLLDLLLDDLLEQYRGHLGVLEIWGDRNGNNRQPNSARTFYEDIAARLRTAGFLVQLKVQPGELDLAHITKHYVVNRLLSEADAKLPRIGIDLNRCKPLIISIQNAPVTLDLKKDKRSEDPRRGTPQEHATHFSDCFDNYYAKKYAHLFGGQAGSDAWF